MLCHSSGFTSCHLVPTLSYKMSSSSIADMINKIYIQYTLVNTNIKHQGTVEVCSPSGIRINRCLKH